MGDINDKDVINKKICIAMVSDFFFPNMGGVETHIYQLAQCLISLGHRVIVITHAYGKNSERRGVRWMMNGLKVYYLPFLPFYNQCVLPTVLLTLPLVRQVLIRERVGLVHGHSAFSALANQTLLHARTLGLPTVFTDHSLFGFADVSSILTNKLLNGILSDTCHVICVSHTSKENTALRAMLCPSRISVIPNAIDADRHSDVRFLIGGDGPKRLVLEELRERLGIQDRVLLQGQVPHHQVRAHLVRGDIFLNTSLTEAFCMAILEGASCGLSVVSTNVGGIPEVLPSDLIRLAEPDATSLADGLEQAIAECRQGPDGRRQPEDFHRLHESVRDIYTWRNVALRTECVYRRVLDAGGPEPTRHRLANYLTACGPVGGKIFLIFALLNLALVWLLQLLQPAERIEPGIVPDRSKLRNRSTPCEEQ
uniref:phosphatidylinositol N-acetylglucosaminyltransferase n=1 Tax=Macrostomum lignano TaxID=282301 RepID=A0A1I8IA14_9PLAT